MVFENDILKGPVRYPNTRFERPENCLTTLFTALQVTDSSAVGPHEIEVGTTVAEGAKQAGVTHFVWSTLPNVEEQSGGKYDVPFFSNKAKVSYTKAECTCDLSPSL